MLSVCLSACLFYVFVFIGIALVSKLSILSCSCIVYCVLLCDIGVLLHLILLVLFICRLTVCITVYLVRFSFHGWWRVRVYYASVVHMMWHVHVRWCMIHWVLCIFAQYDMLRSPSVWAVSICWVLRHLRALCAVDREASSLWHDACGTPDRDDRCIHIQSMWLAFLHTTFVLSQYYRDLTYSIRYFIYHRPHFFYYSQYRSKGGERCSYGMFFYFRRV
jgi:hypothetical protein